MSLFGAAVSRRDRWGPFINVLLLNRQCKAKIRSVERKEKKKLRKQQKAPHIVTPYMAIYTLCLCRIGV